MVVQLLLLQLLRLPQVQLQPLPQMVHKYVNFLVGLVLFGVLLFLRLLQARATLMFGKKIIQTLVVLQGLPILLQKKSVALSLALYLLMARVCPFQMQ